MAPLSEVAAGKLVLSLVLGPLTFFASTAPWIASRIFRKDALDVINVLTAIAAGFVFGGYSTHIIPDGIEAFGDYFEATYSPDSDSKIPGYPWSLLISGLVWAFLVCLDRTLVAHGVHGDAHHSHDHVSQAYVQMQAETESGPLLAASVVHPCTHDGEPSAPSGCKEAEKAARKDAMLRAWLFFIALSIHSVFDGLGVGVTSSIQEFGSVAVAVVAHKAFDGIALGVPVYLAKLPPLQTWGALVFCALMTPLGIGVGWGVSESFKEGSAQTLARAIILSITAGSFLFISLSELLPAALHDGRHTLKKMGCFLGGYIAMAALAAYV